MITRAAPQFQHLPKFRHVLCFVTSQLFSGCESASGADPFRYRAKVILVRAEATQRRIRFIAQDNDPNRRLRNFCRRAGQRRCEASRTGLAGSDGDATIQGQPRLNQNRIIGSSHTGSHRRILA
jgi:hypothetical protein